jgi:hypothetical protein
MGYTFRIGNLIETIEEDDDEPYTSYDVDSIVLYDAPEFPNDELTGKSNGRSPSYSAWSDFCRKSDITHIFYDERGHLLGGHPGYVDITSDMVNTIEEKLQKYKKIATLPPGFEGFPAFNPISGDWETPDEGKYDHILARLIWLEFWTKWALENCEHPAIVNW